MSQSVVLVIPKVYPHQNRALLSLALHKGPIHPNIHTRCLWFCFSIVSVDHLHPATQSCVRVISNPLKIMLTARMLNPSI
ncbi:MAG: hypothetical protein ABSG01_00235 [Anaerolineales bacterium]|jgi:hypothetical protein